MKLILIGPTYPYRGGISHYTYLLDQALHRKGIDSQVYSFRRQYPAWLYPGKSDRDPSLVQPHANASYTLDPIYPWTWAKTVRCIESEKPDLIAIQWWTTFWSFPFSYICHALVRNHLPVIYIIHNVLPHEKRMWDSWLGRIALSPGTGFIAQTPREKDRLLDIIPGAQVTVCPMPVLAMPVEKFPSRSEARERLNIPADAQVLLFFGIVRQYKGLSVLLDALAELKNRQPNMILLIVGEFWEPLANYKLQITSLDIQDMVRIDDRFIPNEELGDFFAASDALVAPYVAGTQSAVVGLALGYGLHVLISDRVAPGVPRQHKEKITVIPAGDASALADAIHIFFSISHQDKASPLNPWEDWECVVDALQKYSHL